MELKEIISRRRSTRKFLPTPVERERLERVVEMALQAPSSRNSRSTRFVIVQNPDLLEKMSRMRDYGSAFMKDAPAAILVAADTTKTDLWRENCAISATILQLAIVDAGLASCWVHIGGRPRLKDNPNGEQAEEYIRTIVDVPENCKVECVIALGYSDFEPKPLPPYEGEERVMWK